MIFIYMDDILVATVNDPELHWKVVHKLLDLLEEQSFFLKPSKCEFKQRCVEYLGLVLNSKTLQIELNKLKGIKEWLHMLKNVK